MKKLTIGMAVYDDFDGAYFTIQSLRMHHLNNLDIDSEIVVIDNNPHSASGKELCSFVENWAKGRYVPFSEKKGTSVRNEIFNNSNGDYTLCIDSHVLLEHNAIQNLIDYFVENPNTKNLLSGPLLYDDLINISTHFDPVWREGMYGIWGTNNELYNNGEPFEIPMMGLGVFACKTSEWPGFNSNFRGFGGEEGYIHEKIRQAGGKCICLPNFKWVHRFGRPNGVPYSNILEDRVWNYFIGWLELTKNPEDPFFKSIINEFKSSIPERFLLQIFEEAKNTISIK